jgi:hypothetical protein
MISRLEDGGRLRPDVDEIIAANPHEVVKDHEQWCAADTH